MKIRTFITTTIGVTGMVLTIFVNPLFIFLVPVILLDKRKREVNAENIMD